MPDGRVLPTVSSTAPVQSEVQAFADWAQYEARQQSLAEMRAHPDATVRLQALALWAEQPDEDLEPMFEALGDEDESVRTRAEEIWEQQLARDEGAEK